MSIIDTLMDEVVKAEGKTFRTEAAHIVVSHKMYHQLITATGDLNQQCLRMEYNPPFAKMTLCGIPVFPRRDLSENEIKVVTYERTTK